MKKSFTLMELLIIVALLIILAAALLVSLNPWGQINKTHDGKRKSELSSLGKVLEDWYNDKNCYPKPIDICYPGTDNGNPVDKNPCYICGSQLNSPTFSPYLSNLACDPIHPNKKYLYQTDGSSCSSWYIIYASLSNNSDPVISEVGCQNGCGPAGNINYNYFISSSNVILQDGIGPTASAPFPTSTTSPPNPSVTPGSSTPTPTTPASTPTPTGIIPSPTPTAYPQGNYICCDINSLCQACGSYSQCINDVGCRSNTEIYLSGSVSCHSVCQQ